MLKNPHPVGQRLSLLQTTSAEGLSLQPPEAQTGGQIPEFWIDILQVPLEALTLKTPPQVQSALDAEGRHNNKNTAVSERGTRLGSTKHNLCPRSAPTALWSVLEKLTEADF